MESPLNAREFLGRFHLPQLVRISLGPASGEVYTDEVGGPRSLSAANLRPTTRSSQRQHEPSDWTYRQSGIVCDEQEEDDDDDEDHQDFASISAWSSAQVSRMLERRRQVRVPRAALKRSPMNKSLDLGGPALATENGSLPRANERRPAADAQEETRRKVEQSIKLAPPSERPARAKLQLEQPFLLYKAHRKLELEAYALDPQNEVEARSGDPIYFPQHYPGWFSFASPQELTKARLINAAGKAGTRRLQSLETIDQVCRSEAQVFLTRDELLGYQLPSKLSHLTKLNNNQLLALPLAINLDKKKRNQKQQQENSASISDIKQVAIASGQVLKICGIYEDVLPLIEGKQQQHNLREIGRSIKSKQRKQETTVYQQHHYLSTQNCPSHHKVINYSNPHQMIYAAPPRLLERQQQHQHQHQQQQPQQQRAGQRYARCILLNESSLSEELGEESHQEQTEEAEVLVPMDQRGRFYLCATNQTLLQELNCQLCSLRQSSLVFRLTQLIYLLNLTRRLGGRLGVADQSAATTSGASLRLPLTLRLVHGPRPSKYSPTMFGCAQPAKSALDSYFQHESNVAGHSLQCAHNKNFARCSSDSGGACACARRLTKAPGLSSQLLGSFSGLFRVEALTRRDVLLACTIKRQPLLHLAASLDAPALADSSLALAEPGDLPGATADTLKALGKSSFRRLRACRSLISLNGRRNRRRPKIPSALMGAGGSLERPQGGARGESNNHNGGAPEVDKEENIVMVEFDCDEPQLRFVRTFVESSIPSASIPDLVLSRLDHCARESRTWQRQLKLTYSSLGRDFDSCGRQMELGRRLRLTCLDGAAPNPLPVGRVNPNLERPLQHQAQSSTETTSSSNSSTARSSSGVSSAAANDQQQRQAELGEPPAKPAPEGATGGSRLLRLVQLVLPHRRPRRQPTAVDYSPEPYEEPATLMNAQKLHRRLLQRPLAGAESGTEVEVESVAAAASAATTTKEDSASHLYESLERLNEAAGRLAAASKACAALEAAGGGGGGGYDSRGGDSEGSRGGGGASKAQSRSAAATAAAKAGPRRNSAEPLVGSRRARANSLEAADEDDELRRRRESDGKLDSSGSSTEDEAQWRWPEEEDWWLGRRRTAAAAAAAAGTVPVAQATGEAPGEPMEPVSIEHDDDHHHLRRHCRRHFASNSSSHHSSTSSLGSPVSAPSSRRTASSSASSPPSSSPASSYMPAGGDDNCDSEGDKPGENIYVNLVDVDGASWCSSGPRRAGRMGRKLAKLRRVRRGLRNDDDEAAEQQWEPRSLSSHHLQPHHHHHHQQQHHHHHQQPQRSRLAPINPFRLSLGSFGEAAAGSVGGGSQQAVAR